MYGCEVLQIYGEIFFLRGELPTYTLLNANMYHYMSFIVSFSCKNKHHIELALISKNSFPEQTLLGRTAGATRAVEKIRVRIQHPEVYCKIKVKILF